MSSSSSPVAMSCINRRTTGFIWSPLGSQDSSRTSRVPITIPDHDHGVHVSNISVVTNYPNISEVWSEFGNSDTSERIKNRTILKLQNSNLQLMSKSAHLRGLRCNRLDAPCPFVRRQEHVDPVRTHTCKARGMWSVAKSKVQFSQDVKKKGSVWVMTNAQPQSNRMVSNDLVDDQGSRWRQ